MQTVDPAVSQQKFQFELNTYLSIEETHRTRGVFMIKAEYPDIILLFSAPRLQPSPIVFAVKINFDNYDLEPLSVRFIHPFTFENLLHSPVQLLRKKVYPDRPPEIQTLAQKDSTGLPFICIPGIREYHNHPAHTGDSWLLHRNKGGEGTLGFIVDKLYEYGISAINTFQFQLVLHAPQLNINFDINSLPE
ncbi:MAG: hypothetical protein JNK14_04650 [Chitinophagaceae bacterium]|nr:hypothetical protein [Chitinophagaceae bacterium]